MTTKLKVNSKAIEEIKKLMLSGKKEIKKSELERLGFELSSRKFEIKNIVIEKNLLFDTYYLSLKDKLRDLNGNLISENEKLLHRVEVLWNLGKKKMPFKELHDLEIFCAASEIRMGNIMLLNYLGIDKSYSIELINTEKNIENKWPDSGVTMNRVMDCLSNFKYDKEMYVLDETPLNKELEKYFKSFFVSVKKSGPSTKGLLDLIIGSGKTEVAIELKLARQVNKSGACDRCCGQIEKYHQKHGKNLFLVVAGHSDEENEHVRACFEKANSLSMKSYFMKYKGNIR